MSGGFRSRTTSARQQQEKEKNAVATSSRKEEPSRRESHAHRRRGAQRTDRPRETAFEVLMRVYGDGAYTNIALSQELRDAQLSARDAAFVTEIVNGTVRKTAVLQAVVEQASRRPADSLDVDVQAALYMGAYQLLYMRVPAHAAVSTTTELVRTRVGQGATGFVNAVLRHISRHTSEEWWKKTAPQSLDKRDHLAHKSSHPRWIVDVFADALTVEDRAEELESCLASSDERPRVHLVALPGLSSAEDIAQRTGGITGTLSPYSVTLTEGGNPAQLDVVKEGLARVQDEGSQLIAWAMARAIVRGEDDQHGEHWLDLCAGPGGKAALLGAEAAQCGAEVTAVELQEHRARLTEHAVRSLPVSVWCEDGTTVTAEKLGVPGGFDRVLVDAPCTGLGSLRRRPESRWRRDEKSAQEMRELQIALLRNAAELARPGGIVVYSTCSPDCRETREIVETVAPTAGLTIRDATELCPQVPELYSAPYVQLWTHRHGTDAMFLSLLEKTEETPKVQ